MTPWAWIAAGLIAFVVVACALIVLIAFYADTLHANCPRNQSLCPYCQNDEPHPPAKIERTR